MATEKIRFETVEEYIGSFPKEVQDILTTVRQTVRQAVPEAEEVISYQIPAFKYNGWVLYYSAYKNHYSLSCPPPFTVFDVFKEELKPYELSRSAMKFPFAKPIPVQLIGDIARYRAKENEESQKLKGVKVR